MYSIQARHPTKSNVWGSFLKNCRAFNMLQTQSGRLLSFLAPAIFLSHFLHKVVYLLLLSHQINCAPRSVLDAFSVLILILWKAVLSWQSFTSVFSFYPMAGYPWELRLGVLRSERDLKLPRATLDSLWT